MNCFKSNVGQLGEGVGLDEFVECLHDLLVLAGIVRESVNPFLKGKVAVN